MKQNQKRNNQKGITLVALVVTIVVLLILAGITIAALFSDNGIIAAAQRASDQTKEAVDNTEQQLQNLADKMKKEIDKANGSGLKKDTNGVEEGQSGYLGSDYKDPYIPAGFTHTEGTWNNGYTIKGNEGTANAGDEFVWVPCTLTATEETVAFARLTTNGTKYNSNNLTDFSDQDGARADSIKTSVGIHKGFYIAKYEASSSNDSDMQNGTVRSLPNKTPWVSIQRSAAIDKANAMVNTEDNVKSALISGECWDTTLQWMVTKSDNATANNTPNAYDINSIDKGWYSNNSGNSKKDTGTGIDSTNQNKVNNIWDMAGNVYEWTTENCEYDGDDYLVLRGGNYSDSGSDRPAAYRNFNIGNAIDYLGFRVVLYK